MLGHLPDSSVTVRKMLSRGRNIMQWCSDLEARKEISQARVKLHTVWFLDGVERDCRLALLQGELCFSESVIAFPVLLKTQKSLSPSLLESTDCCFYLAWDGDWGLDVSMLYGEQSQAACLNFPQEPREFLVLSAVPGSQCWALVALECLGRLPSA